ncbi:sugar ABC transporter ATP-binding protein [Pelomonas sp. KK5]|uniref:sugar ABC transporter ATP-binding protein n=1 Tax=Pelomonas sp. KK5 TaxID=1855730 RepID=UPI00097C5744|nr:sugar ABC transporter ATP-binding protein [Pelomonas sp. KK5]
MSLVQMRNVSKAFAGVRAVEGAQFELRPGEVHALMGENGAGKSTLMKMLAGVYQRDGGEILLDGKAIDVRSPREALDLGICIVHQELNLMNHLSAAQNIFIGREPRKPGGFFIDARKLDAMAATIFERMKLRIEPGVQVGALTVARQQMVEIAKALSFDSRVLIMDEPTAALNEAEVADLFAIIRELRAQGVGIVYISHKMDELKQIADRVTVMRDGRYVDTRPMATTSMADVISMMVGRELDSAPVDPPDTATNEVVLEARGLTRGKALRDVSFKLRRGEILGFAGLLGAGRTETARAVFGADVIEAGEIFMHGKPVKIRSPRDAVRLGIGYLSEDRKQFGLATGLDVQSNVALASMKRFLDFGAFVNGRMMRTVAQGFVKQLAIRTPSVAQTVRLLSGGNQQKIVIAKWILRDCEVLFFDEPTRGIDVGAKAEIYRLLDALAAEGKAIVMISSELPEVLRMSHRIVVMCEGRVTGELPGRGATQEQIMELATRR